MRVYLVRLDIFALVQALLEKVRTDPARSFQLSEWRLKHFNTPWHFHPEIELTLILEGHGRRFVGDSLEPFAPGDLVLLGPNLPHFWQSESSCTHSRSLVVQFKPDFLGTDFWTRPEMRRIGRLLARSQQGLSFNDSAVLEPYRHAMAALSSDIGLKGLTGLLHLLDQLARDQRVRPLASRAYPPATNHRAEQRLARIYDYAGRHFARTITLPELAREVAMTPAAFSRFFKRVSKRSPSDFLNDLRIEHACRLLRESDRTVTDIAAAAGFPTLTNFNRRFRERNGTTPREYRQSFLR